MSACGSYAPNEHDLNTPTRSETWPDFPVPNPRGTTQTPPAPLAHPPHPPLRIAPQISIASRVLRLSHRRCCAFSSDTSLPLRQLLGLRLENEKCGKRQPAKSEDHGSLRLKAWQPTIEGLAAYVYTKIVTIT